MKLTALLITPLLLLSFRSLQAATINCKAERLQKIYTISKTEISMQDSDGRAIASLGVRTRRRGEALEKVMNFNNTKITIHIGNQDAFSPLNDYIVLKNEQGHEITYPLECSRN